MSSSLSTRRELKPAMLPNRDVQSMDFRESGFFRIHRGQSLPSPAEVRARLKYSTPRPKLVSFPLLGLMVKYGLSVDIAEAQNLWAIQKLLKQEVPTPELYGWRIDDDEVFIYMQLVDGDILHDRWDSLTTAEKSDICEQLRLIVARLRTVQQDPTDPFIGLFNRWNL